MIRGETLLSQLWLSVYKTLWARYKQTVFARFLSDVDKQADRLIKHKMIPMWRFDSFVPN